jgi:hypothetical protein
LPLDPDTSRGHQWNRSSQSSMKIRVLTHQEQAESGLTSGAAGSPDADGGRPEWFPKFRHPQCHLSRQPHRDCRPRSFIYPTNHGGGPPGSIRSHSRGDQRDQGAVRNNSTHLT